MFGNYLKVALRTILRNPSYTVINVAGLAVGLACCITIALYVASELTYDQYHADADRVFRVAEHRKVPLGEIESPQVCPAVVPALRADFSEVEYAARIDPIQNGMVEREGWSCYEDRMVYADPDLLEIFSIPVVSGDVATPLDERMTVIITERMVRKYFGDTDPVGQTLRIKDPHVAGPNDSGPQLTPYTVTAVVADPPSNTHFKYDIIASLKLLDGHPRYEIWDGGATYSYVKLKDGTDPAAFGERIRRLAHVHYGKELSSWGQERDYYLQPLKDIHFESNLAGFRMFPGGGEMEPPGNRLYLYIYSAVGLFVLLIGCMNFINLSNAHSVRRAREVGLRKVVGAGRFQLVRQFLGETLIITALAAAIALALTEILLPVFNEFAGTQLSFAEVLRPEVALAVMALILLVGTVAGGYPAFVLTAFMPISILKGAASGSKRGSTLLRLLVLGQFAISIFLAVGTVTVYQQLDFMRNQALGFEKEQKFVLPYRWNRTVLDHSQALKTELLGHHAITGATASSSVPGRWIRSGALSFRGGILDPPKMLNLIVCDFDFIPEYGIEMVAGRSFEKGRNDERNAFVINEAAVAHLGYGSPEEAVGKHMWESWLGREKVIVGVTRDFHYEGMQHDVAPLFMEFHARRFNALTVTLSTTGLRETLGDIEAKWHEMFPGVPFEGFFLDENFDRQYRTEMQVGKVLGIVTAMGLSIACLGLLGLAGFMTRLRTREIAVRKVLGASETNLTTLISRDFTLLVMAANLVACPSAFYAMNWWLEDFANRIEMDWLSFALPAGVAFLLALITVGSLALKAARSNPVEALRYE